MIKLYESQICNCQKFGEAVNAERETHNYGMKLRSTSTTENLNSSENNVELFKSNIEETFLIKFPRKNAMQIMFQNFVAGLS